MKKISQAIKKYSYLLVIAFPLMILVKLLSIFGVNVPYADHWALVPLFMKLDEGTFGIHDLWAQHNEHRILFPRAVSLILARLTNWYTPVEIIFSVLVSIIGIVLILLMLNKGYKNRYQMIVAAAVISLWFFSPIQWQNWLWGWQIEWFMCVTSVLATVYFLDRYTISKSLRMFSLAAVSATIATFSLGSGIFIWIAGLIIIGCSFVLKKISKKPLLIWGGVGLIETFAYYYNYHKPLDSPSITLIFESPLEFLEFFITTLGRPVTSNVDTAYLFGLIVFSLLICLAVILFVYRQKINWVENIKWLALIVYSLIALLGTSVARLGLGMAGAMGSRYTAFSLLILIGLTVTALLVAKDLKMRKATQNMILIVVCILSLPLIIQSYVSGVGEMRTQSKLLSDIKLCTSIDYPTDHCLTATYPPSADAARGWLRYLKDNNYAGY